MTASDHGQACNVLLDVAKILRSSSLSAKQRRTLQLVGLCGLTLREAASKLCESRENVRQYSYRGLEKVRHKVFQPMPSRKSGAKLIGPGKRQALRNF
jgi:DNA-directed RNA polymerase specialized sigma24 family protein